MAGPIDAVKRDLEIGLICSIAQVGRWLADLGSLSLTADRNRRSFEVRISDMPESAIAGIAAARFSALMGSK